MVSISAELRITPLVTERRRSIAADLPWPLESSPLIIVDGLAFLPVPLLEFVLLIRTAQNTIDYASKLHLAPTLFRMLPTSV